MATTNTYVGVWNPNTNTLPTVKDGVTFGQWFVTTSGRSSALGLSFMAGDWLIYIKDDNDDPKWYKTNGGLVTISSIGNTNSVTPDWYTKVYINSNGAITNAGTLDPADLPQHTHKPTDIENISEALWPVLADTFQTQRFGNVRFNVDNKLKKITASVNIDEETVKTNEFGQLYSAGGGGAVAPSDVVVYDQIKDLISKDQLSDLVWPIVSNIFQNQKLGNVRFKVDPKTKKIYASIVVDETSIGTNEFGQLCSLLTDGDPSKVETFNGSVTISQVVDLENELQELRDEVAEAKKMAFDINDLPIDGQTITINSAGQLQATAMKNQKHTHTMDDIEDLPQKYAAVPATKQELESDYVDFNDGLFKLKGLTLDRVISILNKNLEQVGKSIETLEGRVGKIKPAEPYGISRSSIHINTSTVQALNKYSNSIVTAVLGPDLAVECVGGVYPPDGIINVKLDGAYFDSFTIPSNLIKNGNTKQFPTAQGQFNVSLKDAYFDNPNLTGFYNKVYFTWTLRGGLRDGSHTVTFEHNGVSLPPVSFNFVNPLKEGALSYTFERPFNNAFVSGIPCCADTGSETAINWSLLHDGSMLPVDLVRTEAQSEKSTSQSYVQGRIWNTIARENGINSVTADFYNFDGSILKTVTCASPYLYFDPTDCEKYRVIKSGNSYYPYRPNTAVPLGELVIQNGFTKIDKSSYAPRGGPDYTNNNTVIQYGRAVHSATFCIPCTEFINNFFIDLYDQNDEPIKANKYGQPNGVIVDATLCNNMAPQYWGTSSINFIGRGGLGYQDNFGMLDLFRSKGARYYFTFGQRPNIAPGNLFVKFYIYGDTIFNIDVAVASILRCLRGETDTNPFRVDFQTLVIDYEGQNICM